MLKFSFKTYARQNVTVAPSVLGDRDLVDWQRTTFRVGERSSLSGET